MSREFLGTLFGIPVVSDDRYSPDVVCLEASSRRFEIPRAEFEKLKTQNVKFGTLDSYRETLVFEALKARLVEALAAVLGALMGLYAADCGRDHAPEADSEVFKTDRVTRNSEPRDSKPEVVTPEGVRRVDSVTLSVTAETTEPEGVTGFCDTCDAVTGLKTIPEKRSRSFTMAFLPCHKCHKSHKEYKYKRINEIGCDGKNYVVSQVSQAGIVLESSEIPSNLESREARPAVLVSKWNIEIRGARFDPARVSRNCHRFDRASKS